MEGAWRGTLFWVCLLSAFTVARGEENTAVIVASVVAGLLLLILFVSITIYCFYRNGAFIGEKKKTRHRKHPEYHANGFYPPHHKPHRANGHATTKLPDPGLQIPHIRASPMYSYATYSGPPPELHPSYEHRHGTFSGPPPVAVIPTQFGSVAVRPDPRPVVHSRKYRKHKSPRRGDNKHRSPTRGHHELQEFVVQPSYDGIPVVRPVIYVDDKEDRARHRSKSRDRKSHTRGSSSSEPRVIEIKVDTTGDAKTARPEESDTDIRASTSAPKPASPTPQQRATPIRSRASSVTEAVNALRMSVQGHLDDDDDDTVTPHSSKAPSLRWTADRRSRAQAPDPVAGDVMFFPAGQHVDTARHIPTPPIAQNEYSKSIRKDDDEQPEIPPRVPTPYLGNQEPESTQEEPQESTYSYSKIIRSSRKDQGPKLLAPVNQGYEIPSQLRQTTGGIREGPASYETEHSRLSKTYVDQGASMSDRLAHLVEDGDKTRFTHYTIDAVNFGPEEDEVQLRRTRPKTPPVDIPRSSLIYSKPDKRPATPPNDIPLITPSESTEIPPLNLRSSATTPRADYGTSARPTTPPQDFPITPKSSFVRPRPSTPPFDVETGRSAAADQNPPDTGKSGPVDPSTGQPGSFQARQKFIEAHLMKNVSGNQPNDKTASVQFNKKTELIPRSEPTSPRESKVEPASVVITPGVIPVAPPPPPLPKNLQ